LLDHPRHSGTIGDVEVENAAEPTIDREPHVEDVETHRRDDEEIHRGDRILVIAQEGQPALDGSGL
jgi:hypothetical protein